MAQLPTLLVLAALSNVISSAPAPATATFAGGEPLGVALERPDGWDPVLVPAIEVAGEAVLKNFVSFSIELAFFPDFAGNKAKPNTFTNNLLEELGKWQGGKPNIRVGGNTQDYALFDPNLGAATRGLYTAASPDYPTLLTLGPSFFESYTTLNNTKFIHGFNLAKNTTAAIQSLQASAPYACKALSNDNFLGWEMGNEPDLYKTSAQGVVRPASWTEGNYVNEWNQKVQTIKEAIGKACGEDWTSPAKFKWIAPSFAGTKNSLDPVKAWAAGLDDSSSIMQFSSHNYIGGATQPGVTLAGTLMNHTRTASSVAAHVSSHQALSAAGLKVDYILGETNSLYNQGAPGLSNSFGAALWVLDFNLLCAASNIKQVYMHMGTDYRYASWQPIATSKTSIGTKAPYYGNVAVAASLGDLSKGDVRVASIPLEKETEAAYAVYNEDKLVRLVVINLAQYNYSVPKPLARPEYVYNFTLPVSCAGSGTMQRLAANGSDAITGITFDGFTYNYEVDGGRGKLLSNTTREETVWVGSDGGISVNLLASSAVVVQLMC